MLRIYAMMPGMALGIFKGPVWASQSTIAGPLVDRNRQFSDDMIKALIERDVVIGGALDAWMMVPNWVRQQSTPKACNATSKKCSITWTISANWQVMPSMWVLGTDLDGAFGKEQSPYDLETIADLQKITALIAGNVDMHPQILKPLCMATGYASCGRHGQLMFERLLFIKPALLKALKSKHFKLKY